MPLRQILKRNSLRNISGHDINRYAADKITDQLRDPGENPGSLLFGALAAINSMSHTTLKPIRVANMLPGDIHCENS